MFSCAIYVPATVFVRHLLPPHYITGHSKMNIIVGQSTNDEQSGHIRTLHDPLNKPVHVQQSRLLLRSPPLHIPRSVSLRTHQCSFNFNQKSISFTKARFCKWTVWRCCRRCQMPPSLPFCSGRLQRSFAVFACLSRRVQVNRQTTNGFN